MKRAPSIGQLEQLVLTAIIGLPNDAYGVSIHRRVSELTEPKRTSLGAIYVALDRLEDKGMITSALSDPTPARGGRAKRCYQMEALGERVLQDSAATAKRMWESVVQAWGEGWIRQLPGGRRGTKVGA